jgi:hypothetical protein
MENSARSFGGVAGQIPRQKPSVKALTADQVTLEQMAKGSQMPATCGRSGFLPTSHVLGE